MRERAALPLPSRDALVTAFWLGLALALLVVFPQACVPFLVAYVLAWVLDPFVCAVERRLPAKIRASARPFATFLVLCVVAAMVMGVLVPLFVSLLAKVQGLVEYLSTTNYTRMATAAYEWLKEQAKLMPYPDRALAILAENRERIVDMSGRVLETVGKEVGAILAATIRFAFGGIAGVLALAVIPILVFYFLLDARAIARTIFKLVPSSYQVWARGFFTEVDQTLKDFLKAQALVCTVYGVVITLGLAFLGIQFAFVIGPLAGVSNFVPYLGVLVGLAPAVVLAIVQEGFRFQTLILIGGVGIIYLFLNVLDGLYLSPRITAKAVRLHPLLIIFALYIGGQLGGVAGLVLAVPVAACLRVLLEDLYGRCYDRPWG